MTALGPRRQQSEAQIQRAVFQHFRARGAPEVFAFHPANGGFRRPIEAAILKGLGVRAGVPDLIACRGGRFYALELKTNNGKLSDAQEQVLAALREAGSEVAVTYGLDAALAQLERWQLLRGVMTVTTNQVQAAAAGQGNARRELRARRRAKGNKRNEQFNVQHRSAQ
jgi:VRR-NUC domain